MVSAIYEFHLAIGQYRNYIVALQKEEPDRVLFLVIPDDTYQQFFSLPFIQDAIEFNQVNYLVYDVATQVVVKWKKQSDTDKSFKK